MDSTNDLMGGLAQSRMNRRDLLRRAALGGALASMPLLAAACDPGESPTSGSSNGGTEAGAVGNFPETPEYEFVFVNHVTTNSFFRPTIYGLQDAAALLGIPEPQWTGSEEAVVSEMVDAFNTALSGGADGIAVAVVDPTAFNDPMQQALDQGIPVLSYNADGRGLGTNPRLAYIGQDLFGSGVEMGKRIVAEVKEGPVALFIATPGQLNIQPRIDGAIQAIKDANAPIEYEQVTTGALEAQEIARVESYYNGHKDVRGMFAVDNGSTVATAQAMEKFNLAEQGVVGGGFDLHPTTLEAIDAGHMSFTIDQQPYLQGFYTTLQLFVYQISGGLTGPSDTNTGLLFVTKENVAGYLQNTSRYEGDSEEQKVLEPA